MPDITNSKPLQNTDSPVLQEEYLNFSCPEITFLKTADLEKISKEQLTGIVNQSDPQAVQDLNAAINLATRVMEDMNNICPALPNDSAENLSGLFKIPSAEVALLKAHVHGEESERVIGWSLAFTEPEHFPDLHEIPEELMEDGNVIRANRMFVDDNGQSYSPYGQAAKLLLDAITKIADGRRIIGKFLTDRKLNATWLRAEAATGIYGYQLTEFKPVEEIPREGQPSLELKMNWGVYPPFPGHRKDAYRGFRKRFQNLEKSVREKTSTIAAHLPVSDQKVLAAGSEHFLYSLANLFPANQFRGIDTQSDGVKKKNPQALNLQISKPENTDFDAFPDSIDAVVVDNSNRTCEKVSPENFLPELREHGLLIQFDPDPSFPALDNYRHIYSAELGNQSDTKLYVHISEKLPDATISSEGIGFIRKEQLLTETQFLDMRAFKEAGTENTIELACRPNDTLDIIPWYRVRGRLYVIGKTRYPRPITECGTDSEQQVHRSPYITEQISALCDPDKLGNMRDLCLKAQNILAERAGIGSTDSNLIEGLIKSFGDDSDYLCLPGMVDERVHSLAVKIPPLKTQYDGGSSYDFSSAGFIQPIEASLILNACQTGALPDARMERKIYEILSEQKMKPGLWTGAELTFTAQNTSGLTVSSVQSLFNRPARQAFIPRDLKNLEFLNQYGTVFSEFNAEDNVIAEHYLEYVKPGKTSDTGEKLSTDSASILPVVKAVNPATLQEELLIGLEFKDFAAAQLAYGNSELPAVPTYILPLHQNAESFSTEAFKKHFNLNITAMTPLGGAYFASPGVTPQMIQPYAAEIDVASAAASELTWVRAEELIHYAEEVKDAQTLTCLYRLLHAHGSFY